MNFHNAGSNSSGTTYYNSILPAAPATSYTLTPQGYGMFAFSKNGQGKPLTVTLSNPSSANVTAYALLEPNGTESMHIINRSYGSSAVDVTVNVNPGNFRNAQLMCLQQTNSDVTALSGVTLGGKPVNGDGTWTGGYTKVFTTGPNFAISVPHAQAAVIHFF